MAVEDLYSIIITKAYDSSLSAMAVEVCRRLLVGIDVFLSDEDRLKHSLFKTGHRHKTISMH